MTNQFKEFRYGVMYKNMVLHTDGSMSSQVSDLWLTPEEEIAHNKAFDLSDKYAREKGELSEYTVYRIVITPGMLP